MCRIMHEHCEQNGGKCRFLDPFIVNANMIADDKKVVQDYMMTAFIKLQEMDAIYIPYLQK